MNYIVEYIKQFKPVYIIFLLSGVAVAIIVHFLSRKKYEKFWFISIIYFISLILSMCLAYSLNLVFNRIIESQNKNEYFITEFSFLNTLVFFVFCVKVFSLIFEFDFSKIKEPFIISILSFLCVAKIGCFLNGCCASKEINGIILHFNLYESIFAFSLIVIKFIKKIHVFDLFFIIYFSYRFVSEFLRASYSMQIILFGIFTPTHIVSFIGLLIVFYYKFFRKTLNKKKGY